MTDTLHLGDKTTGCEECAARDYIQEIITAENYESNAHTMEGALRAWVNNAPTYYLWANWSEWITDFQDSYQGEWVSEQDFADNLADETITGELSELGQIYFDYEKFTRDLFLGDYWYSDGFIFRNY
jgi:antirestriction protein